MKRLITREHLANYLRKPATVELDVYIPLGEALVAAEIQTPTLHARSVEEKHRLLYDTTSEEVVVLRDGPATAWDPDSVTPAIQVDGIEYPVDTVALNYWSVRDFITGFSKNTTVTFRYIAGWTPENCPEKIKQAIILVSTMIFQHPDSSVIMEKIGDYVRQSASKSAVDKLLPNQVLPLVSEFKRPR